MTSSGTYDYGLWGMVAFNIILFGGFVLSFLRPRRRAEWRSLGVFAAFIVALFAEMYGFPLTIYVLTSVFGRGLGVATAYGHVEGHLLATIFGLPGGMGLLICQLGALVMLGGLAVMWRGWRQVHAAQGHLVRDGVYAHVRHPQYAGLFLITLGMLIQWPTLPTLLMWPILMLVYYRLARREERELLSRFGEEYARYRSATAAFLPRLPLSPRRTADAELNLSGPTVVEETEEPGYAAAVCDGPEQADEEAASAGGKPRHERTDHPVPLRSVEERVE